MIVSSSLKGTKMKSESYIILELGAALLLLGVLCFIITPVYEKGAWFVIGTMSNGFSLVLGYKFGRSMPQQATDIKPGQDSQSKITSEITAVQK
jgi:hypothetical protein